MIKIIKDKQLIEDIFNYNVVLYGMGINNAMNKGFSYDIALHFPVVYAEENETGYGNLNKYGTIRITDVYRTIKFCACYCYNIGLKRKNNGVFIDYELLEKCLNLVKERFNKTVKIVSPIIGQDKYDGNGDKETIINIYSKVFGDEYDITLYDFEQWDFKANIYKERVDLTSQYKNGKITKDELKEKQRETEWKRLHGIYEKMPDDYEYKQNLWAKPRISIKN